MYAREWKCRVPYQHKEGFLEYLKKTGLSDTKATPGCIGGQILERYLIDAVELTLVTHWDTLESIKAYAGSNITKARLYPEDEQYQFDPDKQVTHYEVMENWQKGNA